jgi:hypothetical protein
MRLEKKRLWILWLFTLFFLSITSYFHGVVHLVKVSVLLSTCLLFGLCLFLFIKNIWKTLLVAMGLLLGLSLCPRILQITLFYGMALTVIMILFSKRKNITVFFEEITKVINKQTYYDLITWCLLFSGINFLSFGNESGVWVYDSHHPVYEASLGRSYQISYLHPPDISYSGKEVRYHFLSTQLPFFLSNIMGVDLINSLYFYIPMFMFGFIALAVISFFYEYPDLKTPVFIVFFLPLISIGILQHECFMSRSFFMTVSFLLAAFFTILALCFFIQKQKVYFFLTLLLLLITKASFFLVIFGGGILYYFRKRSWKDIVVYCSIIIPLFIVIYNLFLSGAHQQQHWIIFPTQFYFLINNGNALSYILVLFPVAINCAMLFLYFKFPQKDYILFPVACSLSGICGSFLLTEIIEDASRQFLVACFFPLCFLLWFLISKIKLPSYRNISYLLIICLSFFSFLLQTRYIDPVVKARLSKDYQKNNIGDFIDRELIDAYSWLENNTENEDCILIGKHYEVKSFKIKDSQYSFKIKGFDRSALSGKQFFCEDYKYKSIGMKEDYPLRFASINLFYRTYVNLSQESKERLDQFNSPLFGIRKAEPYSEMEKIDPTIKFYRTFNPFKEWSWLNRKMQINWEIKNAMVRLEKDIPSVQHWGARFLAENGISYIVTEKGDKLKNEWASLARECFKNNTITIYQVNRKATARIV